MSRRDHFLNEMRRHLLRLRTADPLVLDADTAERLLDGRVDPADAPPGYGPVAGLLAAAAAPASAAELAGQQLAVAAAFAAAAHPSHTTRRSSMLSTLLRAKVVAALATATIASGGVAAAATGTLPAPVQQLAHHTLNAPAPHQHRGDHPGRGHDSDTGRPSTDQAKDRDANGPDATGPARSGLCQAYQAGRGGTAGNKLDAVAFQALAKAAGGADKVADYCGEATPGKSADHPPAATTTRGHSGSGHRQRPAAGQHRSRKVADGNPSSRMSTLEPDDTVSAHASGHGHNQ